MAMMPKAKTDEHEENVFWTTMSDLMLGLAVVFMTLFVLAISGFSEQVLEQKQQQVKASNEIVEKLKEQNIEAEIDKMTGDIKISDLELFEVNSWVLSKKGQQYLDKLIPIYIDTIFSKPELLVGIDNIVVQGHTDSQSFSGLSTKDEQFAKNMELSLKRANSVAQYMFKTNFDKQYSEQLRNMMAVEGKSFANPILKEDGSEDYAKSRRVELKLKVKRMDLSKAFGL